MIDVKRYLTGRVCPRCFVAECARKDLRVRDLFADASLQALFDAYFFEPAAAAPDDGIEQACCRTRARMQASGPVRHAVFAGDGCVAGVDRLVRISKTDWAAVCLVASTHVRRRTLVSMAFVRHVLAANGLQSARIYVLYVNRHCRRTGALDPRELFILSDVTCEVRELQQETKAWIDRLRAHGPDDPGPCDLSPYGERQAPCTPTSDCYGYARTHPAFLHGVSPKRVRALVQAGHLDIRSIPDQALARRERIQKRALVQERIQVDQSALRHFLASLTLPLSAFDFESIAPLVPAFEGDRVRQAVPFAVSCARLLPDGSMQTRTYVHPGRDDPRPGVLKTLMAGVAPQGSVLVYHASYERSRLQELAVRFPAERARIRDLERRLVDVLPLFSSLFVYHPDQDGSTRLKAVSRALLGETYGETDIEDGKMAQEVYDRSRREPNDKRRARMLADLSRYVTLDATVLLRIHARLVQLAEAD